MTEVILNVGIVLAYVVIIGVTLWTMIRTGGL